MIRKVGSEWFVFNKSGEKRLSKGYSSKEQANKRLQQIEYFKHQYDKGELVDNSGHAVTTDAGFMKVINNDY